MAEALADSLRKVHIGSISGSRDADWIDSILDQQGPRKRVKQGPDELKRELERKFLTPPTSFSTAWLNKLQQ